MRLRRARNRQISSEERDVAPHVVFHVQADNWTMTPRALFHPARLARRPVLSTQSDERLVDLVRAGSDPAFEAIVERYRRPLMRYVSRLLQPERAEDVVQQAFVKAYEAMHRDAAELNLRPWLYRIAHNGALNALRDRALGHAELHDRIDGVERPDQALERTLGLRELVVAVQALPERQRSAILLRELEGRSYEEIAVALGVTDGAVRQLLNRARNSLRAAAAAITPMPLVTRVASEDSTEPITARVAELVGVGGSAIAMKLCATALVTGAVVGGAAVVPDVGREQSRSAPVGAEAAEAAGAAWAGLPRASASTAGWAGLRTPRRVTPTAAAATPPTVRRGARTRGSNARACGKRTRARRTKNCASTPAWPRACTRRRTTCARATAPRSPRTRT
jgi:RNA polymerase sigma factor (sigma-70 family)